MSTRTKLLIAIGAITLLSIFGAVTAYTFWTGYGTLVIDVKEKHEYGDRVSMRIPAAFIPIALNMVPDEAFIESCDDEEFDMVVPMMKVLWDELEDMPDTEIVRVETLTETVRIEKEGRLLLINVDTATETVHLSVPIQCLKSVTKKMEKVSRRAA